MLPNAFSLSEMCSNLIEEYGGFSLLAKPGFITINKKYTKEIKKIVTSLENSAAFLLQEHIDERSKAAIELNVMS